ncbi:hypothetical protein EBZ39_00565 [bacterium]|nr:hypothetical protein [bacterium]
MPYKDPEKRREASRRWYQLHKDEQKGRVKKQSSRNRREVYDLKEATPCADCGKFYPHYVMEYDHVRGKKVAAIANMINTNFSRRKVHREIKKCELVCANCHRCRTFKRLKSKKDAG